MQVGLVEVSEDDCLKRVKGRTVPILFDEDDDADALLCKSVEKHGRHFKQFDKDIEYVILYQDMTLVKNLPGTTTPFTLGKYKHDLLKPYSKIYFWLCTKDDFQNVSTEGYEENENDAELMRPAFDPVNTDYMPSESSENVSSRSSINKSSDTRPSASQSSRGTLDRYLVSHQCPTCMSYFHRNEIEAHADICAESWIDPVGECAIPFVNLEDDELFEESHEVDHLEDMSVPDRLEAIKGIVEKLKQNVSNTSINRIMIRRRAAFVDYVEARSKKYFKPEGLLKVTFVGEPAIDGGGPRREFFTGTV